MSSTEEFKKDTLLGGKQIYVDNQQSPEGSLHAVTRYSVAVVLRGYEVCTCKSCVVSVMGTVSRCLSQQVALVKVGVRSQHVVQLWRNVGSVVWKYKTSKSTSCVGRRINIFGTWRLSSDWRAVSRSSLAASCRPWSRATSANNKVPRNQSSTLLSW